MKNYIIAAALVALISSPTWAAVSIVNSKHDMIAAGFATANLGAQAEVCVFCHTPHGAQTSVTQAPLWNNTPIASVDATMYVGIPGRSTINFAFDQTSINATDARLCLACHDGTVSGPLNGPNVGNITIGGASMSATASLGTDMSNDHPIGMNLGATPETNPSSTVNSGLRTLAQIRTNFGNEDPFEGGVEMDNINFMWCSSCHDVHDSDPLMKPFLRISNVGSALCKACHIK